MPSISKEALGKLAMVSDKIKELWRSIESPMYAWPPYRLGFPSDTMQSTYYPDSEPLTEVESELIQSTLAQNSIWPENIRIQKKTVGGRVSIQLLQASEEFDPEPRALESSDDNISLVIRRGDLDQQLWMVCRSLNQATRFVANFIQQRMLYLCQKGIESGDLNLYRESLKLWLHDRFPRIEQVFGFVEPYRDPAGIKAEFEGLVGIMDLQETQRVQNLLAKSGSIVRKLPWVLNTSDTEPFGPFEKVSFEGSGCICMNIISYASSMMFSGVNLPNVGSRKPSLTPPLTTKQYNDIRETLGHKSLIMLNLLPTTIEALRSEPFIRTKDKANFDRHLSDVYYRYLILHEVFGHPTGKMMREVAPGQFTFDQAEPPLHPITRTPIKTYYRSGETWTGVFGELATSVDECRCKLVAAVLMHDEEVYDVLQGPDESGSTWKDGQSS